jgi:hypothetical protein
VWINYGDGQILRGKGVALSRVPCVGESIEVSTPAHPHNYFSRTVVAVIHTQRDVREVDAIVSVEPWGKAAREQTAAEQRDAFCLDAARSTIEQVRAMVGARYDEATTDAVARALRGEWSEG